MEPSFRRPLVPVEWLAAHLHDRDLRVVHVSPDRSIYDARHIPGAVYTHPYEELAKPGVDAAGVEREYLLPPGDEFEALASRWGVRQGDRIVFYDDVGQNRHAIRGYWNCLVYGFARDRVHVLDGGLPAWEAAQLPLTADVPSPPPGDVVFSDPDPALNPTAEEVLAWSRESATAGGPTRILDVRTVDEYLGRDVRARRGGRIPGARHRLWSDFVGPDNRLRSGPEALAILRATGVRPEDVRAVYCQGGVRAALVWFTLHELAGLEEVRNYAGSWEEWANRPELPVET